MSQFCEHIDPIVEYLYDEIIAGRIQFIWCAQCDVQWKFNNPPKEQADGQADQSEGS